MKRSLWLGALVLVVLSGAGCPGDGSGLAEPVLGGLEPTLPSIQQHIFGAICVHCHVPGGTGPFLLDSEDHAYENLVNVPSLEVPTLDRVEPGDPEASYIVHKIEGRADIIGDPMPPPPTETRLGPDEIAAIRQWIQNGAPR